MAKKVNKAFSDAIRDRKVEKQKKSMIVLDWARMKKMTEEERNLYFAEEVKKQGKKVRK